MASGFYENVHEDFYDEAVKSPNPVSRAYHLHRYQKIRECLQAGGLHEGKILDIGCGSCAWNTEHWKITGFDLNAKLLEKGMQKKRLGEKVVGNFENRLPFESSSFDAVVLTEVLEHLENPKQKLCEIARVLRKGGFLVVTVPFGGIGIWNPLFSLQCAYMGWARGHEYYRKKCGHINSFDGKSLARLLLDCGFSVEQMDEWMRFNLCALARKK